MRTQDGSGRQVNGGGSGAEGDHVTPTRVTALTIEVVQRGAVRTTLTVSLVAKPAEPAKEPALASP
ncbi:hypothetical protein GCM10020218_045400 [Dactylosporangium vinaceum]